MHEPLVITMVLLWSGATLLLAEVRVVRRPSLAQRLRPYGRAANRSQALLDLQSWQQVIGPLCRTIGERVARAFGATEDVGSRLDRLHLPLDVTGFRVRQVGWATLAMATGAGVAVVTRAPAAVTLFCVLGAPVLAFLAIEQRLISTSAAWQRRMLLELPVVAEQLAMLLSAGYSLGTALQRISERGSGLCASDLRRVCSRARQGLSEVDALREWAHRAQVPALDRVVAVLALNEESGDVGPLVSEEARTIRAEVHRGLVSVMDRRGQQVWIPVTVATLIPGVIFLAIPFIEALRIFSGS